MEKQREFDVAPNMQENNEFGAPQYVSPVADYWTERCSTFSFYLTQYQKLIFQRISSSTFCRVE